MPQKTLGNHKAHVKSGEKSGGDVKACLCSGVTFCVLAPVYFLDLGQCLF